jgi:hypothetical protein
LNLLNHFGGSFTRLEFGYHPRFIVHGVVWNSNGMALSSLIFTLEQEGKFRHHVLMQQNTNLLAKVDQIHCPHVGSIALLEA